MILMNLSFLISKMHFILLYPATLSLVWLPYCFRTLRTFGGSPQRLLSSASQMLASSPAWLPCSLMTSAAKELHLHMACWESFKGSWRVEHLYLLVRIIILSSSIYWIQLLSKINLLFACINNWIFHGVNVSFISCSDRL